MSNILIPFLLTTIAGLATGIGGLIVFLLNIQIKNYFQQCLDFQQE